MSAPSPHTPPRQGQKFRFKPDWIVKFKMYVMFADKSVYWQFYDIQTCSYGIYPANDIIKYLTDKHLRPI